MNNTPPSSPPPSSPPPSSISAFFPTRPPPPPPPPDMQLVPPNIDPALALDLRLRWLEAILLGVKQDARDRKGKEREPPHTRTS
ncbi:hypothetical protein D9615_003601 [Tricholomella constricta]|uniref:Uncharacterized protein n=1 Tax=Tricholomella constricta TaxID=117010 RepID=A0A8H5HI09_9AGAR|nr:hypothetical protein D9615_003601 [Tricholomella constricta]